MTELKILAEEHGLEQVCLGCDMYNSKGCVNSKGKILCSTRDYLIKQVNQETTPYNWKNET